MRAQTNSSLMLWLAIVFGVLFLIGECADQKETPSKKLPDLKNGNLNTNQMGTQSISGPISISECEDGKMYSTILKKCINKSTLGDVGVGK
ncbi:hypothetical protein Ocin01_08950 [Orchesella cincta]|uniref:Uncharacterized protein n=1 Tax=Orchesella cincta TaxID=48709 RepID=A0A1D2MXM3_ORCCI|nr:hypothetical protein Ocin01_08950 [Orchesella cincta]